MRNSSRKKQTMTGKKKNPNNGVKKEPAIVTISSSSASEEPNEEEEEEEEEEEGEEEEVKSSNSSNQSVSEESMEEEEEEEEQVIVKKKGKNTISRGRGIATTECRFPLSRTKRIIKSEGAEIRITQEAIFVINKATEHFLEKFCQEAHTNVKRDRKKAVAYKHLSSVVSKKKKYDFLSDFVPEKIKAEVALSAIKLSEA